MLKHADIRAKLLRQYAKMLQAFLCDEQFFPLRLPIRSLPDTYSGLRGYIKEMELESQNYGYRIETQQRKFKKLGVHPLPTAIVIDNIEIMVKLIDKLDEFAFFKADVDLIRSSIPRLENWLIKYPERVIEYHGKWPQLIEVCLNFTENYQANKFIRELPISSDTKFLERHKRILKSLLDDLEMEIANPSENNFVLRYGMRTDESPVRLRLLDKQLERRYGLSVTDITLPITQLNMLDLHDQVGIILENKTSFLALPPLPSCYAIFGNGYDVSILKSVEWLEKSQLLYWGDIDAQGFEILALVRRILPQTQSLMMDSQTYEAFRQFAVSGTPAFPTNYPELTESELELYLWITERNLRLEQEKIESQFALAAIKNYLSAYREHIV